MQTILQLLNTELKTEAGRNIEFDIGIESSFSLEPPNPKIPMDGFPKEPDLLGETIGVVEDQGKTLSEPQFNIPIDPETSMTALSSEESIVFDRLPQITSTQALGFEKLLSKPTASDAKRQISIPEFVILRSKSLQAPQSEDFAAKSGVKDPEQLLRSSTPVSPRPFTPVTKEPFIETPSLLVAPQKTENGAAFAEDEVRTFASTKQKVISALADAREKAPLKTDTQDVAAAISPSLKEGKGLNGFDKTPSKALLNPSPPPQSNDRSEGGRVDDPSRSARLVAPDPPRKPSTGTSTASASTRTNVTASNGNAPEIRYFPNTPTQALQQEVIRSELVEPAIRGGTAVPLQNVTEVVLLQKPTNRRLEGKPSFAPEQRTIESEAPTKTPIQAKPNNPSVQPATQFLAPVLATTAISDPIPILDGVQSRESGIPIDGPDFRKDSLSPQRIEGFARPVVQQLTQVAKAAGDGSIEVRLAPEELGRVRLSLNPGETNITVHISAERQETMDLIRRNIELFSQSLKQEGFSNLAFSFGGSGGDQTRGNNDRNPDIVFDEAPQSTDTASVTQTQARQTLAPGQLDIRI